MTTNFEVQNVAWFTQAFLCLSGFVEILSDTQRHDPILRSLFTVEEINHSGSTANCSCSWIIGYTTFPNKLKATHKTLGP